MKVYNKLVRDKIPEIIRAEGRMVKTRILNDKEYRDELNKKLQEEVILRSLKVLECLRRRNAGLFRIEFFWRKWSRIKVS